MLLSIGATNDLTRALPKIAGVVLGLGVFDCFARAGARGWLIALAVFLGAGVGIALVGLLGTQWSLKFEWLGSLTARFEPRIAGLPGAEKGISPNELAGALLWVLPTLLTLSWLAVTPRDPSAPAPRRWRAPVKILLWEATVFVGLVFLLCQSRGAYLGLAVALGMIGLSQLRRRPWFFAGALCALLIVSAVIVWRDQNDPAFHALAGKWVTPDTVSLDSLGGRDKVWARALTGIAQYPVTGMGMNMFRYRLNEVAPHEPPIYVERDIAHAHNEFLQAALDVGVPGLAAFIGIYVVAFGLLHQIGTRAITSRASDFFLGDPRAVRWLVLGLSGGLIAHLIFGLTDAVALGAKPGILFWMLLGLIVGLERRTRAG